MTDPAAALAETRLVRVATDLLSAFGTRTEDGRRLTAEWGEPVGHCPDSGEWIYEPVFTAHEPAEIARLRKIEEAARDVVGQADMDPDYCYGCHDKRPCAHDALRAALEEEPT